MCICPAYTFVGTAAAAEQCGYKLHLADVSASDSALNPRSLANRGDLDEVGLVVAVAPYGRPPDQAGCANFTRRTGVPVVIDAAASFEALLTNPLGAVGPTPVVLSFHATNVFSTVEGAPSSAPIRNGSQTRRARSTSASGAIASAAAPA